MEDGVETVERCRGDTEGGGGGRGGGGRGGGQGGGGRGGGGGGGGGGGDFHVWKVTLKEKKQKKRPT